MAVLGAAYRGGVKETAFSGTFHLVEEASRRGAKVTVHDPLFTARELRSLGLEPHELGSSVDAAVLHTDHEVYSTLTARELPGIRVLINGRIKVRPTLGPGVTVVDLGRPKPYT